MRRLAYMLLPLLFFLSCAKEGEMDGQWDGPVIELTLSCDELGMTKAGVNGVQDGDDDYFENVVKHVDFYFYPVTADGKGRKNKHPFHIPVTLTNNILSFRLQVTSHQVNNQIFPTEECEVFALVNGPREKLNALEDLSLDSIYSVVETTDFEKKTDSFNHRQSQFMMSGLETLYLSDEGGRTAKVVSKKIIPVARYACKLTMGIKVDDIVKVDTGQKDGDDKPITEDWRPSVEEMYIYLVDGVKSVTLDGNPVDTDQAKTNGHPEHFEYKKNPMYFYELQEDKSYKQLFDKDGEYYTTYPTYTYPQSWTDKNEHVPYLKLVLPWIRVSDNLKRVCYYKIILPQNTQTGVPEGKNAFLRNNWYRYNIAVGMLGADSDDAEVTVNPIDFFVYYWQDKNVVVKHASIGNARYLSVDKEYKESDEPEKQKYYELNNEKELDIYYTSSHPVTVELLSVTRPYYGKKPEDSVNQRNGTFKATVRKSNGPENPSEEHYYADKLYAKDTYYLEYETSDQIGGKQYITIDNQQYINAGYWFSKSSTLIHFEHALNNNYSQSSFDYSPYTIFLSLHHADDPSTSKDYSRIIKIVQKPAVFIEAEENHDKRRTDIELVDDSGNPQNAKAWMNFKHNGYVFVDGGPRMRHTIDSDDNGPYGKLAKRLRDVYKKTWNTNNGFDGDVRKMLEWMQWRIVNFTGGNRNMYNIVVTVLPENSSYVIGDPRVFDLHTFEAWENGKESFSPANTSIKYYNWYDKNEDGQLDDTKNGPDDDFEFVSTFQEAPALYGESPRKLLYYYPAEESNRTINMLAPSYRVASKFGGLEYYNGVTKRSAEYKCATYQEDGYPAGRWRLPTKAEIDFIATLSARGTFEVLFGTSSKYWSAHGAVQPNSGLFEGETYALARCVYDSWYWDPLDDRLLDLPEEGESKVAGKRYRDEYYFGDMPR